MRTRNIRKGLESQFFVSVPELKLEYELFGSAPVQAIGDVGKREFYFRARHNEWQFEVSNEEGKLPSDVGEKQVFFRQSKYKNASYMPHEEAMEIIENCVANFIEQS